MAAYDVAIIGAGPGGYVAAIRAAQLGLHTVLFERERVGGLCLNWGCIPSKALLRNADVVNLVRDAERWGIHVKDATFDLGAAYDRSRQVVERLVGGVEVLLKENGVEVVSGAASLDGPKTVLCGGTRYDAKNVIIATGATARMLPGITVDGSVVITSREALARREPPKRTVIIGGGPVGVEFAHLWASYGSSVTIVEMLDRILPLEDPDSGRLLARSFGARGITSMAGTRVTGLTVSGVTAAVTVSQGAEQKTIEADVVLLAAGFVPHTAGLNLESAGVSMERGFITIDDAMRTDVPGVYAIGDVTGKLMLAHVAMAQGVVAAEQIAGKNPPALDYIQMPRATFSQPQVGSIGYTAEQATAAGFTVRTGRFPLTALGKAIAVGETEGFVKVVADEATGQILGVHMAGHDVNELLGEASLAALLEATTVEAGFAVHAHPTLSEAFKEAALAANGEAIHIARKRGAQTALTQGAPSR
jgi:dihydrolipoamide dehydrogenase